jgi:hypothetical protein
MDKSRKEFICAAFPKIKYFDIGLTEPAKFKLRKEDIKIAGIVIKMYCFLTKCVPNSRLSGYHCAAKMNLAAEMGKHGPTRPPTTRTPKPKRDGPSARRSSTSRRGPLPAGSQALAGRPVVLHGRQRPSKMNTPAQHPSAPTPRFQQYRPPCAHSPFPFGPSAPRRLGTALYGGGGAGEKPSSMV